MCFWFIPKTASMASSSIGALVAAGSLQPGLGSSSPNVPATFVFFLFLLDGYPLNLCGFPKVLDRLLSPDALAPPLTVYIH